jgi:hypothetical protein
MRILQPFEEKIRHSIRDELAKKPTITMIGLNLTESESRGVSS